MTRAEEHVDPAYAYEFDQLAAACESFLAAHKEGSHLGMLFTCGVLTGQCAAVYKLSPPGGLIDIPAMFVRDEDQP